MIQIWPGTSNFKSPCMAKEISSILCMAGNKTAAKTQKLTCNWPMGHIFACSTYWMLTDHACN